MLDKTKEAVKGKREREEMLSCRRDMLYSVEM
jgi:hypothetical protein